MKALNFTKALTFLVFFIFCTEACKKGDTGPAGPQGPAGARGLPGVIVLPLGTATAMRNAGVDLNDYAQVQRVIGN